jgi:hypothetical protein
MGLLNNSSAGGTPISINAAATLGIPYILAQSPIAVSVPNVTTEETLATIVVPANSLGTKGSLRIWTQWSFTNGVNDKTMKVKFGGSNFLNLVATANASYGSLIWISNNNSASSQIGFPNGLNLGLTTAAAQTSSIDTTAAVNITITGQKEVDSETLTLQRYLVEIFYKA